MAWYTQSNLKFELSSSKYKYYEFNKIKQEENIFIHLQHLYLDSSTVFSVSKGHNRQFDYSDIVKNKLFPNTLVALPFKSSFL